MAEQSPMNAELIALAELAGIMIDWQDNDRQAQRLEASTLRRVLAGLGYPADSDAEIADSRARLERLAHPEGPRQWPPLITAEIDATVELPSALTPGTRWRLTDDQGRASEGVLGERGALSAPSRPGYYRFEIGDIALTLAVAPGRCVSFSDLAGGAAMPMAGLVAQLYGLRRMDDEHGMGDIEALARLAEASALEGIDALAISPLHALFAHQPQRYSPYSPATRLALNPLYVSLPATSGEAATGELIDPVAVAEERRVALDRAFAALDGQQLADFEAFRRQRGETLEHHCRFEAISEVYGALDDWPAALRRVDDPAVTEFARSHAQRVARHAWAQWQISHELERAQSRARAAGMRVGLIADIAVGVDPQGSEVWSRPRQMLGALRIGAPPDAFNARGQEWGVTGFSPQGLVACGFEGFIATLRACLRGAGGLRIDHIMGLSRLWLIPAGGTPTEGAYVRFPEEDLLRLVALESWRHRAVIIGEDLGTVEAAFRQRLARAGIAGMGVMWFERDDQGFSAAADYPERAVAMTTTHDLPSLAGWLRGRDLDWRIELDMLGEGESAAGQRRQRQVERQQLAVTLGVDDSADTLQWLTAAIRHIGATPTPLALLPLEDLLGLEEQPNLPGTLDEHPNWRRRLPLAVEQFYRDGEIASRIAVFRQARSARAGLEGVGHE
ncbi:4-alpha-glucanotransferase [Kushneria aurantia]|uniref:4-alpha-glucanotransferase n=1 Tax=Kushneria aurantia TaxID=504092 RepID=A0ABV6FZ29_9GAMM|nr:4-alpha-glucanotransferase [Kushneria aurantia]